MNDTGRGILCLFLGVAGLSLLVSQWRSGENADLTFDNLAERLPKIRRPLLWFSTAVYGGASLALLWGGIWFLTRPS